MIISQQHRQRIYQYRALQLSGELQNYNGWLVQTPETDEIYLIEDGKKRWIVDTNILRRLFSGSIRQTFGLDRIPNGIPIQMGSGLFTTEFTGDKVFWLDIEETGRVVKRWVTSPEAMNKYHFNWDNIKPVYGFFANAIPDGREVVR